MNTRVENSRYGKIKACRCSSSFKKEKCMQYIFNRRSIVLCRNWYSLRNSVISRPVEGSGERVKVFSCFLASLYVCSVCHSFSFLEPLSLQDSRLLLDSLGKQANASLAETHANLIINA